MRFDDEDEQAARTRPLCPGGCGSKLVCKSCDDTRPVADDLWGGWRFMSPFGRMETVTDVTRPKYGQILVYTKESKTVPWRMFRDIHVTAFPPPSSSTNRGTAEIRVVEKGWSRDAPMFVYACSSTDVDPDRFLGAGCLAQANFKGLGSGWAIHYRPEDEVAVLPCKSKAEARTQLRAIARNYAKKMGVKVRIAA